MSRPVAPRHPAEPRAEREGACFPDEDDDSVVVNGPASGWPVAAVMSVCVAMVLGALVLT